MLIDCQSHLFPPFYADIIEKSRGTVSVDRKGDALLLRFSDRFALRVEPERYDPKTVLQRMDRAGIDMSIMSVNMPGPELLSADIAGEASRRCNDYVAEVCAASKGRLIGLATIPFDDVPFALAEITRAAKELDLRGIVLYSNIGGRPVDAPEYEPIFESLESAGIPMVLHPTVPSWADAVADYSMIPMLGFMVDTSIAMLRLILSGVLERHPGLRIVHPHCGGILPYLMPRVNEQTEQKGRGREHIRRAPGDYYENVYLDLVTPSSDHIGFAVSQTRPDRLLFGTDAPWVDLESMVECFRRAEMPARTRERAASENAIELFRIR